MNRLSRRTTLLPLALACLALVPAASASAQAQTLPGVPLYSVTEAGGQLFWTGSTDGKQVGLFTRPAAGGATRQVGTVPGPGLGTFPVVAFDGSNYAVLLYREEELPGDGGDCGVCETEYSQQTRVIAGTLAGAPRVAFECSTVGDNSDPVPAVAIAGGRTFLAGLRCGAPAGVLTLDGAGSLAVFDAAGAFPLSANGTWLAYGTNDATKVTNLAGGGSYAVPGAPKLTSTEPLERALFVQADGSIVVSGGFVRSGGTAARVPVRTKWNFIPKVLFAGDRLFYNDGLQDLQIQLATGRAPKPLVAPGLAAKSALALNGTMLNVAGYSCTGVVTLRTFDIDAPVPAGAVDGCTIQVLTKTLKLTRKRTINVKVRCPNGCSGRLALRDADDPYVARKVSAPAGGTLNLRYRFSRKQVKALGTTLWFWGESPWLTVDTRSHRVKRPRK